MKCTASDLALILILFFTFPLPAQEAVSHLDSNFRFTQAHPTDTAAYSSFNSALGSIYTTYPDTAIFYSRQLVRLAQQQSLHHFEGRGYNAWGVSMEVNGALDSAIALYHRAREIGEREGDRSLLVDVYNNLGIAFSFRGLYESSLEFTLKALAIAEERKDRSRQAMMYNNIGLRYSELGQPEVAINYYQQALSLNRRLGHERRQISNYNNLGQAYSLKGAYDTAISYFDRALELSLLQSQPMPRINAAMGLATAHLKAGQLQLAARYQDSSLRWAQRFEDEYGIAYSRLLQAYLDQAGGRHQQAIPKLEEALQWFDQGRYFSIKMEILESLSRAYHAVGDHRQAYQLMRSFAFAKDSSFLRQKDLAMEQVAVFKAARQEHEKELLNQEILLREKDVQHAQAERNTLVVIGLLLLLLALGLAHRYFYEKRTKLALTEKNIAIAREKQRSDDLLLNILPAEIAEELKEKGSAEARHFEMVSILFTDFKEFTQASEQLSPQQLVEEINACFAAFDAICDDYGIEKIKTIGDAYMAAGGVPVSNGHSARNTVLAALAMQDFIGQRKEQRQAAAMPAFEMRVGVNTGPVVAGIVGVKKFQYDLWGDTVNTASRIENSGAPGKVNISEATYAQIKADPDFNFESRGEISVKGKGKIAMWFVSSSSASIPQRGLA